MSQQKDSILLADSRELGLERLSELSNLIALLFLSGVIVKETRKYLWEGDIDKD